MVGVFSLKKVSMLITETKANVEIRSVDQLFIVKSNPKFIFLPSHNSSFIIHVFNPRPIDARSLYMI